MKKALLLLVLVSVVVRSQVWDVERLIRARNPGAVFTTTERADVTWQTLRSITYRPTLGQGAVGSASVQEASLVRRFKGRSTTPNSSVRCDRSSLVVLLSSLWLLLLHRF